MKQRIRMMKNRRFLFSQIVIYRTLNNAEIVCKNCVYAHFYKFYCCIGIVRVEKIADYSVFSCLINHFLIDIGSIELYLFGTKSYCTVNNSPWVIFVMSHANGNLGGNALEMCNLLIFLNH